MSGITTCMEHDAIQEKLLAPIREALVNYDVVVRENTLLRAALAHSDHVCLYCVLPADQMSKCIKGFPGCDRADDQMGCPHLAAGMAFEDFKKRALPILERYARDNPKWQTVGYELQDPLGVHALLEEIRK